MRAIAIEEFGGPDKLKPMALPRPRPEKGEVLIRVVAAGVNPVDCLIRTGKLEGTFPHRFPLVPGWDVAGVVEEFGDGASRFRKGDRVWACARKATIQWGCYAEYVSVPENSTGLMPTKLLYEEAASVPLGALTAHQCLFGKSEVGPGNTVLIHAAAGGVGHFAVQLAKLAGAKVIGTAGTDNQSFVLSLGADATVDYTKEELIPAIQRHVPDGVDLVVDTVGGETLTQSFETVKSGGRLVSVVERPDPELADRRGIKAHFLASEPNGDQLEEFARLFDQRKLKTHVQKIYALQAAAEAHEAQEGGHVRGKLVLNI